MIVANFFHIKASNGLFFYGLDYVHENLANVRKALVRPALEAVARKALPGCEIVVCNGKGFLREVWRAQRLGDFLFTPTSHPLPGITRQWVVVHDAYPFFGQRGVLKRALLRVSLATSRCTVAYINRSDARAFVAAMGVSERRQVFAPNRFPAPAPATRPASRAAGAQLVVGLVGTDSAKKNYAQLFDALRATGAGRELAFRIYGHASPYFLALKAQYPDVDMTLVQSDSSSLEQFLSEVHVLASAAEQEGFGRPIAAALLAGFPVFLVDGPVFREFFSEGAEFHSDVHGLVAALLRAAMVAAAAPGYHAPPEVVRAYALANSELGRLGKVST